MPRKPTVVSVSVQPFEIVCGGGPIRIDASEALDRATVRATLHVGGVRGDVELSRSGRTATWTPRDALPFGPHELRADELVTARGVRLDPLRVPFRVVSSTATVPHDVCVQSYVQLRVDPDGVRRVTELGPATRDTLELMKGVHRRTGAPVDLAFDADGRAIDAERVLRRNLTDRARRLGKLHPALHTILRGAGPAVRIEVAVWLRVDVSPIAKSDVRALGRRPTSGELEQRRRVAQATSRFAARWSERFRIRNAIADEVAPVVFARLSPAQIREVAADRQVAFVFLHDTRGVDDLIDSLAISNADDVIAAGTSGDGVRVAVWERGPDSTADLDIAGAFATPAPSTSAHARLTHGIISNTEIGGAPNGYAPDADLYSANDYELGALRWAVVTERCTVVSQSFHRDAEQTSDVLSFDDIYKDWLALNPPYPLIVQAAGNSSTPATEYVNHKGFNTIAVGSHDDTRSALAGTSVTRNPSSPHGDRELPEIAANGVGVTAVGLTSSGTSFAAPAVAGVGALLQSRSPLLRSWPEGCRAILFASAVRMSANTWWQDVSAGTDVGEGAGSVDAEEAIAITRRRVARNNVAQRRGWDVGTLRRSDFGSDRSSTFRYRIAIPAADGGAAPRRVKVALAWDSNVWVLFGLLPVASTLDTDFDLQVHDSEGRLVGYSGSWDNSYEIVDFVGRSGATYTIRVRRWSGGGEPWYGIAWTVV